MYVVYGLNRVNPIIAGVPDVPKSAHSKNIIEAIRVAVTEHRKRKQPIIEINDVPFWVDDFFKEGVFDFYKNNTILSDSEYHMVMGFKNAKAAARNK